MLKDILWVLHRFGPIGLECRIPLDVLPGSVSEVGNRRRMPVSWSIFMMAA